jgi:hypothetical protein
LDAVHKEATGKSGDGTKAAAAEKAAAKLDE